jgi:hypothetical protein
MTWKLMFNGFYNKRILPPSGTEISFEAMFKPPALGTNPPPSPLKVSVTDALLQYCNLPLGQEISGEEGETIT